METLDEGKKSAHARNDELLRYFDENIEWYRGASQHARNMHRWLGSLSLVLAIAIPLITTASTASSVEKIPNVTKEGMVLLSICLGFVLAVSEALQRFFGFERNWTTYYSSLVALEHQKSVYLDRQARAAIASDDWWSNLGAARAALNDFIAKETAGFFENLKAVGASNKGGAPGA